MKNKASLWFMIIGLIALGGLYWYLEIYSEKTNNTNTNQDVSSESSENDTCKLGYICETIDNKTYEWSRETQVEVSNEYNYDTDELEAGKLSINDNGVLEFIDLKDKVLFTYDYIEDEISYIDVSPSSCENKIYVILTKSKKLYISDSDTGLFASEPFYLVKEGITEFEVVNDSSDSICNDASIYVKRATGEVTRINNENVIE